MRTKELFAWIKERYSIKLKKDAGKPKPWTKDQILMNYRFCNVHREDDTVTKWIRESWREPYDSDKNLWFAMTVARLVNWPETLYELAPAVFTGGSKCAVTWRPEVFIREMHARRTSGMKVFSGAYIVGTSGRTMDKAEYLATHVLTPLWNERHRVVGAFTTLAGLHQWLMNFQGMGSFMAAQVVADVKYQTMWRSAPDWETFAAPGPGSQRGLNRIFGGEPDKPWKGNSWYTGLMMLKKEIDPLVAKAGMPPLHAQDLQNCLCEFDKYERTRLGEGKPRSKYPGGK
jgi:hypothetical protein